MKWSEKTKAKRRGKYKQLLELVAEHQHHHPGRWAEIERFDRHTSASEAATRLRKEYSEFAFRSAVDQETREGVLYAMYLSATLSGRLPTQSTGKDTNGI